MKRKTCGLVGFLFCDMIYSKDSFVWFRSGCFDVRSFLDFGYFVLEDKKGVSRNDLLSKLILFLFNTV